MAEQLRIFVSYSHDDIEFCDVIVKELRSAGADVWFAEHNLGWGQLIEVIERELRARSIFVVILSPAALRSDWVKDEAVWAYKLYKRDNKRIILPVTAAPLQEDEIWLFLQEFMRIEAPGYKPYPVAEAARRLVCTLIPTPKNKEPVSRLPLPGKASTSAVPRPSATAPIASRKKPAPVVPQFTGDVDDLLARGKALTAQDKYAEARSLFERATELAPGSFDAWDNLGWTLRNLGRYTEALDAYGRALALDRNEVFAWANLGYVLDELNNYPDALHAYNQALDLDPDYAEVWHDMAKLLRRMGRIADARAAEKRARELGWRRDLNW